MKHINDCWDIAVHDTMIKYTTSQLWRHIRANAKESETEEVLLNLTKLTKKDLNLLAAIRFLLSKKVRELLWETAPKIISRLSKASANEIVADRSKIKGRISWPKTAVIRAMSGNDNSLFIYAQKVHVFDLPENRLFLHLLQQINSIAKSFVSKDYLTLTGYADTESGLKWTNKIDAIASRTEKMLKIPVVSKISQVKELNEKVISSAYKCRQDEYKKLANIGEVFLLVKQKPLKYINSEYAGNILEPLNKDSLYELAVLFKAMETATSCGWVETKSGLIGGTSAIASIFTKDDIEMRFYTQHIPPEFKEASSYGPLMTRYGLGEKLRRPDIIIEIIKNGKKQFLIIEVKRSKESAYLADGTYKLLGYLKDFEKVKPAKLTGFLVGWDDINSFEYQRDDEVCIFSWTDYGNGFATYLKNV